MTSPEEKGYHEVQDPLGKSRLDRIAEQLACTLLVCWRMLRDPNQKIGDIRNPVRWKGLIQGAVIGNPLWHPTSPDQVIPHQPASGLWAAWDPNRDREFPRTKIRLADIHMAGRLASTLIDPVKDNGPDELTPTNLLTPFRTDHALTFKGTTPAALVENGLARQTTMGEAYERLGLDSYVPLLQEISVAGDMVYQVTPKGNTLIHVIPPSA